MSEIFQSRLAPQFIPLIFCVLFGTGLIVVAHSLAMTLSN